MYSPTTRVLTVLELLQTHGRMSGVELAKRLEVDGRTLRRYITRLDELGIPVTSERGRHGHYSLVAGYKLPPMMFTDDEALAISVGLLASRQLGLAEAAPAVESAQAKLERVLPAPLKTRLRALAETVTLDLRVAPSARDNETLMTLSTAAHQRQRVHLHYRSPAGNGHRDSERDFDPYGLAWRARRWYVVGWCHLRRDLRSFRLDRIERIDLADAHFAAPESFDALAYLAHGVATLPRAISVVVLLKTDLKTARAELFEAIGVFQPCAEGVLLHSQADDLVWYARQLSRLPFAFEVREPDALRGALVTCAHTLLRAARASSLSPPARQSRASRAL
jgi:predicted DNA-binding transcriptional regulator YafY